MAQSNRTKPDLIPNQSSLALGVVGPVLIAVLCFAFVASSERGLSISIRDAAVNDLGYLERPASVIEKNDRLYGWAIAIEREEIDSVRIHFAMSNTEHQTLVGIGRPATIEHAVEPPPLETISELQDVVATARIANDTDSSSMPVVELADDNGSIVFASPRVLMRHCPSVDAPADVFRVDGVYIVLEGC